MQLSRKQTIQRSSSQKSKASSALTGQSLSSAVKFQDLKHLVCKTRSTILLPLSRTHLIILQDVFFTASKISTTPLLHRTSYQICLKELCPVSLTSTVLKLLSVSRFPPRSTPIRTPLITASSFQYFLISCLISCSSSRLSYLLKHYNNLIFNNSHLEAELYY